MGRRSQTESIARIYRAFLYQRTWAQAELAREVGLSIPALRKRLDELTTLDMPLEREEDPPQIFWSVPQRWFPGGAFLSDEDLPDLLHILWHSARGSRRAKLLRALLGALRGRVDVTAIEAAVITREVSATDEAFLPLIESSIIHRAALRMRFWSTERGIVETRQVSVHRVEVGPPARLVATCHRSSTLKWFRVDNIVEVRWDESTPYRDANEEEVARFSAESIDGFHGARSAEEHVFFVRYPEARWVQKNLLPPMRAEQLEEGIRVRAITAGALRVARYVVALGAAAKAETARLEAIVEDLARGALSNVARWKGGTKSRADAEVSLEADEVQVRSLTR